MIKRNTKLRRQMILRALDSQGEVHVDALANEYQTSEVTIRKDLQALEDAGLLMRRYGGAVALPKELLAELGANDAVSEQKQAIAKQASSLIRDHNRIIVDSGTTTRALIPYLGQFEGLVVMTNSLAVSGQLRELENEPTILMTGGTWDKRSESFQGRLAEKMLREYDFDQLFIGADGFDVDRGSSTYNEYTNLSRTMAEVSREVILMAESSKTMRKIPNLELSWNEITTLVTDAGLDEDSAELIRARQVQVISSPTINGEY
jgi:DeoR/GlpR family transcriptional regulator of sugar metabolism